MRERRLPRNVDKFAELIKEAIPYTMEVGGFNNPEIDKYRAGVGEIIFAEKADRQMTVFRRNRQHLKIMELDGKEKNM